MIRSYNPPRIVLTEQKLKKNMSFEQDRNDDAAEFENWFEGVDLVPEMPSRGDLLDGVVAAITNSEVLVSIGAKSEGVIPGYELDKLDDATREGIVEGSTIRVYVVNPEDNSGNIALSILKAKEFEDWDYAENLSKTQEVFNGVVTGYNKGGLIVEVGQLRGFVPASQISADRRREVGQSPNNKWAGMQGDDIMVKVIEVDRSRNRLILSERAASKEIKAIKRRELFSVLTIGDVREGRIISLADFGVFVDIGGADGLVHLSELTWKHIDHPKEMFKVGQKVEVEILNIDHDKGRIALSMKRREADPWDTVVTRYKVGQLVRGQITRLTKFGAFARILGDEAIEGLVHVSEISAHKRIMHPKEMIGVGEQHTLRVIKIDPESRRLGLSIKEVDSPKYAEMDMEFFMSSMDDGGSDDAAAEDGGEA